MSHPALISSLLLIVLFCVSVVIYAKQSPSYDSQTATELSGIAFLEAYKNDSNGILIDIRTPQEFQNGHLDDALNIDYYQTDFITAMKSIGEGKTMYIYCRSGNRTTHTSHLLRQAGLTVIELADGLENYTGTLVR